MWLLAMLGRHWKPLALIALMLGLVATGYAWKAHNAAQAEKIAWLTAEAGRLATELGREKVNVKVVTKYVDRVQVVQGRTRTIIKEVPVYVTPAADAGCTITDGFVRVHDAAATGIVPESTGNPDAPAPGVALSTVAETVTENYGTAHEIAEQLKALQDWIRAQQALK